MRQHNIIFMQTKHSLVSYELIDILKLMLSLLPGSNQQKKQDGWLFECHYIHRIIFESIIQMIAVALWNKAKRTNPEAKMAQRSLFPVIHATVFNEIYII